MKARLLTALGLCILASPIQGMIMNSVTVDGKPVFMVDFNIAQTDAVADESTVGFGLDNNFLGNFWKLSSWKVKTGSADLTPGLDVKVDSDICIEVQKFPNGDAEGVKWMYIQGADLRVLVYSDITDKISMKIRPIVPAVTVEHPNQHTAALNIKFYYSGTPSAPIAWSPPIVAGNLFLEDIHMPAHPSSSLLWGRAIRADGINDQPVRLDFVFGSTYADRWGIALEDFRGYLDGQATADGFTTTGPTKPSYSLNYGRDNEEFRVITTITHKFSAHDIQAGVFRPAPRFTDIQRDPAGIRVFWLRDTNRTYRLEYYPTLGGTTNIVATKLSGPEYLDTTIGAAPSRFYRLREE